VLQLYCRTIVSIVFHPKLAKRAKQLRQLFYNDLRRKSLQSRDLKAARPLKLSAVTQRLSGIKTSITSKGVSQVRSLVAYSHKETVAKPLPVGYPDHRMEGND
jgi:hypothetical protein